MKNVPFVVAPLLAVMLSIIAYAEYCTCVAGGSQMYCVSESDLPGPPAVRVHFDLFVNFDDSKNPGGETTCSLTVDESQLKQYETMTKYWINNDGSLTYASTTEFGETYGRMVCR